MRRRSRIALLVLLALALLLAWRAKRTVAPAAPLSEVVQEPVVPSAAPPQRARVPSRPPSSTSDLVSCAPSAAQRCLAGDVWLVDGCGRGEEKLEECGRTLCREDECEEPDREPCLEPPEGRCVGDVVHLCLAGRALEVDCRKQGLRCATGAEGAECLPLVPETERCGGATHCEGDVLVRCVEGVRERVDCEALRARCLPHRGAEPACVAIQPPPPSLDLACGPCGCPEQRAARESKCDGRDEDGDGLLDEGLDCGPIAVIAFLVSGAQGETSYVREDVEAELSALNAALARTDAEGGLRFVLEDVQMLADAQLLTLDPREIDQLAHDPRVHPERDGAYVPIVFTDVVLAGGDTPKPGVSTLPNGTCGSMQQGYGPEVGVVAVGKGRYPTTVAHEVGHFLGLCHTHDRQEAEPFVLYTDPRSGRLESCRESCRGEGDGVCDTPFDPGPELCAQGEGCAPACRVDARPDTENLMSYYAACRARFTREQVELMQHTAALRRSWQRCFDASCPCQLGGDGCPTGMTCRPTELATGERAARCALDGPRSAGADCSFMDECGRGAICVSEQESKRQRCVRPCLASSPGCECRPAGGALMLCREDLAADVASVVRQGQ